MSTETEAQAAEEQAAEAQASGAPGQDASTPGQGASASEAASAPPVVDGSDSSPVLVRPRIGVRAAVVRDGEILLNRYRGPDGDLFDLPGGGQEHGESQDDALIREVLEETGARVRPYGLACTYEVMLREAARTGAPIRLFHQLNIVRWCGLEPGEEPSLGPAPDGRQIGVAWLPIAELDRHDVRPRELAQWLMDDPSVRPTWIGTLGA
ncbi:NUDIX domain-containing protein [Brachybacterium nesterenkovii]|uniref:NUDIX domain-containing protein n=1 Tax=Brachybacterium nesterenkovii TaxID=47847 RepID=UPI0032194C31